MTRCACLLLCLAASGVQAADTATLRLMGPPADARIYVDGREAASPTRVLHLVPGPHDIQIEAPGSKGEVMACRFAVRVDAGENAGEYVHLFPVRPAPWWPSLRQGETPFQYLPALPGTRGPEGVAGTAGRPFKGWTNAPTDAEIVQCLKEAVLLRLDALEAQEEDAAASLPPAYRFHAYVYDADDIRRQPPGPSGSPGAQGTAGLPADVFALEDTQGVRLLDQAMRSLNWPQVAQPVRTLITLTTPLPPIPQPLNDGPVRRLRLLTPAWRARYEQNRLASRKASLAAPTVMGTLCPPGDVGPTGPHGAKGADGVLPPDATLACLAPERVRLILDRLRSDQPLQKRLQHLQEQTKKAVMDTAFAITASSEAEQSPSHLPFGK